MLLTFLSTSLWLNKLPIPQIRAILLFQLDRQRFLGWCHRKLPEASVRTFHRTIAPPHLERVSEVSRRRGVVGDIVSISRNQISFNLRNPEFRADPFHESCGMIRFLKDNVECFGGIVAHLHGRFDGSVATRVEPLNHKIIHGGDD